ncbi:MAG: hypothetical protein IPH83_04350 [Gammaproteobacteria bacterium]|nr:hypothetical protein [Gammaproteobacteria bacterium]
MTVNLFVLSTGFQYYFSTLLIEHLGLEQVSYAMYQPREGIERRAALRYPVVHVDASDPLTRLFGKKAGKRRFAHRVFGELGLRGQQVRVFCPYYNESFVYALRKLLERNCPSVEYNMIPDGAALLRQLPGVAKGRRVPAWLFRLFIGVEPASTRHKSGSYSPFLDRIYHFEARTIHADPQKVVIVPLARSQQPPFDEVLVLGGLRGISEAFVLAAREKSFGQPVKFRMHPKNRRGIEFIATHAPDWIELELSGILEEHLLAHPYRLVIGYYSSAVMFNQLFIGNSRSEFIVDADSEDPDYHVTADACGIPVTLV